jgi:hypothetical protein
MFNIAADDRFAIDASVPNGEEITTAVYFQYRHFPHIVTIQEMFSNSPNTAYFFVSLSSAIAADCSHFLFLFICPIINQ